MTTPNDPTHPPVTVTVEFLSPDESGAAVAGQVIAPDGQPVPFSGWIGLLEVLEACALPASVNRRRGVVA